MRSKTLYVRVNDKGAMSSEPVLQWPALSCLSVAFSLTDFMEIWS